MGKGGARNRSGPQKDPSSGRSDRLGVRFGKLPRAGYSGRPPAWPLTTASTREKAVWTQLWKTPQAAAWATEPWRHRTVAMYVRWSVRMEEADAPAAVGTVVVRLGDQIGLTPAGLRENQWEIEEAPNNEATAAKSGADGPRVPTPAAEVTSPKDRLMVVLQGGASAGG